MGNQLTTKSDLKKQTAIKLWGETHGHITNICKAIGVTRKTFYMWRKNDPDFSESLVDAEEALNDDVKGLLVKKCKQGDMTAIIFYLKNRHPEFKQGGDSNVNVQVNNLLKAKDFFDTNQ